MFSVPYDFSLLMTYTDFGLHKTGTGIEDTGAYDIVLVGIARIS